MEHLSANSRLASPNSHSVRQCITAMLLVRHMRTGFVLGWFFFWFFFSRTMCVCSLHALQRDRWAGMLLIKSNAQKGKKYPEVKSKDGKSKSKDIVLKHYFGRSHLQETNTT